MASARRHSPFIILSQNKSLVKEIFQFYNLLIFVKNF